MMKNILRVFSFVCAITTYAFASFTAFAQDYQAQQVQVEERTFTEAELAQMLAPIALYPDSLLTHILIASTYPIEIVEAQRWLLKNDKLNAAQLVKAIETFEWDASVKALVPFERILSRLSEDLRWTQQLGDAFLQDEERLLISIQALREQAKLAGNLDKMENLDVSYEKNNIIIEPREQEIVYVPYYDTRMVYGTWHWSSYPPVYWTPHHNVFVNRYRPFAWHSGIHISFNYFFSAFHWNNHHVVVVNPRKTQHYQPRRQITRGGYAKRWLHKPIHRRGVAYKNRVVREKYHGYSGKKNWGVNSNRSVKVHKTNRVVKSASHSHVNLTTRNVKKNMPVSKHHDSKNKTSRVITNSPKSITNKPRTLTGTKNSHQSRTKQPARKTSSKPAYFNRTKEKHSKERY